MPRGVARRRPAWRIVTYTVVGRPLSPERHLKRTTSSIIMEENLDIEIDTEKLISLIKDQPAIYDRTLPPLGQKEKTILWLNICKELIPGWEERPQLEKTQIGSFEYYL